MNAEEYYRPMLHAHAHDVLGLSASIKTSVIIFVIICKVQLFSSFICLFVPLAVKIYIFFSLLFCYIILAMNFH
jgi:hypothetical protein